MDRERASWGGPAAIGPLRDISRPARLMANPARAAMLQALLTNAQMSATDLAVTAGVSPSAGSNHLGTLAREGMVRTHRDGKHVFYRIASPSVEGALRALEAIARHSEHARAGAQELFARTCYRHLGGRLGVAMADVLLTRRYLVPREQGYGLGTWGRDFLVGLGVDVRRPALPVRPAAIPCMDRTEGRPHIGGFLGIELTRRLFALGWIERIPGTRAVTVSGMGERGIRRCFGVECFR